MMRPKDPAMIRTRLFRLAARLALTLMRAAVTVIVTLAMASAAHAERVRDLGSFQGVRSNQLTGYGIVVGLPGSGDDDMQYLQQAMRGVSGRMGIQLPAGVTPSLKNAAAVIVTADLPASPSRGRRSTSLSRRWARPSPCAAVRWC